jgi:hypothetical protein
VFAAVNHNEPRLTGEKMNTKRKGLVISGLLLCLIFATVVAIRAQQTSAVQMAQPASDIAGGKPLALKVKLDKPLPTGSVVIARVKPEAISQIVQLTSSEPDNAARTEFTLKTALPSPIVPGKWLLESVFITLPGSSNWQAIEHNPLTFEVQGKPFPIPSKAEVAVSQ